MNAVKSTSARLEDPCKIESKNISETSDLPDNTGHSPLWNEVKFIDRDPHWYTRRVKEAIHIRLHPNNINRDSGESGSMDAHDQETQQQQNRTTADRRRNNTPKQRGSKFTNQSC